MRKNYYKSIRALLGFKDRLNAFRTNKNARIIKYLEDADIDLENENSVIPGIKDISEQIKVPRLKVSTMIWDLYLKMLESFSCNPIVPKKCIVTICISIDMEELLNSKNKKFAEEEWQKSLEIELELFTIPRIGESIHLNFIDNTVSWDYGYVYMVIHNFTEGVQRVTVIAHPFKNYYHEWNRLKETYERDFKIKQYERSGQRYFTKK